MNLLEDIEEDLTKGLYAYSHIYFLGIGGIGMSAIARWFHANGKKVAGYDKTKTDLTISLEEEGMLVTYKDDVEEIPEEFKNESTLIVVTPAIPSDASVLQYYRDSNLTMLKRSQVLGLITQDYLTVAVAGTHGKTTTSTMITHLLHESGEDVTAFLGGISSNLNSNLLIADNDIEQIVVVEADEFDRSFLTLHPDVAVVTSVEADHLDIYGKEDSLVTSFKEFAQKVPHEGTLIVQKDFSNHFSTNFSYGKSEGDYYSENRRVEDGRVYFDAKTPEGIIRDIPLNQPGYHNMENALAAIAVAQQLYIPKKSIRKAFDSYKGVKRRFEYIINTDELVYIDDYAHHPTEIEAFLMSVKELYPNRKVTAVFQPHLYSRTRDFCEGFSKSLSIADELILLDIYPARELPIEGVTSQIIADKLTNEFKICSLENAFDEVVARDLDVLVTVGAGSIDTLVQPLKNELSK